MIAPHVLFGDASFYIALFSVRDVHHDRAILWQQAMLAARSHVVTTERVLWEVLDGLSGLATRSLAMSGYRILRNDRRTEVVDSDAALAQEALRLYESRGDKEWGITDCLSFTVMKMRGLSSALTADRHFEQAGFAALLLSEATF